MFVRERMYYKPQLKIGTRPYCHAYYIWRFHKGALKLCETNRETSICIKNPVKVILEQKSNDVQYVKLLLHVCLLKPYQYEYRGIPYSIAPTNAIAVNLLYN